MTQSGTEQVHTITDAPEPQPAGPPPGGIPPQAPPTTGGGDEPEDRRSDSLRHGDVVVVEGDTSYRFAEVVDRAAAEQMPPVRRRVIATRLRALSDLLDF